MSAAYKPLITIHDDNDLYFCKNDLIFLKRWNSFTYFWWYFSCTFFFKKKRLKVSSGPCFHLSDLCMSLRCPFVSVCLCLYVVIYYPEMDTWENIWPEVHSICSSSRCQWEMQVLITLENMATSIRVKYLRGNTRVIFYFKKQIQTTY